jgi:hypothetical protein
MPKPTGRRANLTAEEQVILSAPQPAWISGSGSKRAGVVTANARSLPARMCSITKLKLPK